MSLAVYHAIYLEELTATELIEKIAQLFNISPRQINQIFKQGPTGIHVLVSDEVRPCACAQVRGQSQTPVFSRQKRGGTRWYSVRDGTSWLVSRGHVASRRHLKTFPRPLASKNEPVRKQLHSCVFGFALRALKERHSNFS